MKDTNRFNFVEFARKHFSFLEDKEWTCAGEKSTGDYISLRYTYRDISIEIGYCFYFYELDAGLNFKGNFSNFYLGEVFNLMRKSDIPRCGYQVTTMSGMDNCLKALSETVREAVCFLLVNPSVQSDLEAQRIARANENAERLQKAQILQRAAPIWREKRFSEFVRLLAPIRDMLGKVDAARLEYAEKQIMGE